MKIRHRLVEGFVQKRQDLVPRVFAGLMAVFFFAGEVLEGMASAVIAVEGMGHAGGVPGPKGNLIRPP